MRVQHPAPRFHGLFRLPGDKSVSHRAALFAALSHGTSVLRNFSTAADCASTLRCLQDLGVDVRREGETVTVGGQGMEGLHAARGPLDAGNSGSTLRMLAGLLAGRPFRSVLDGDASLRRRPMERIAVPLRLMGARITSSDGRPPLVVEGGPLSAIDYAMPVASAQVKTAVLLAGLQAEGTTTVREPARSRDHTERLLPLFGATVHRTAGTVSVVGGGRLRGAELEIPGDPSSAAFLLVAALIVPDARVRIEGVLLNPTRVAFLDVLRRMGGRVTSGEDRAEPEPVGWIEARSSSLRGLEIGAGEVPALIDEIPILAVAATRCSGELVVRGAEELRVKESDRIAALVEGLRRMGADVVEHPDGLTVRGGAPLRGSTVRAHGDHRIAMAFTVAALVAAGATTIEESESVSVSFPEFFSAVEEATGAKETATSPPARIVLVGFMGAGKSTVGPLLARELGWGFLDLDREVERRLGETVAEVFARHGEARFREAEEAEARTAGGRKGLVVAAGGGAFAQPRTRAALQQGALTVWLRCALEALLPRIGEGADRPLAWNRETIASLLVEREPSYRRADLTVDTTDAAPDAVAREIAAAAARAGVDTTRPSSG